MRAVLVLVALCAVLAYNFDFSNLSKKVSEDLKSEYLNCLKDNRIGSRFEEIVKRHCLQEVLK